MRSMNRATSRVKKMISVDVFPEFSAKVRRAVLSPLGFLCLAALLSLGLGLLLHPRVFTLFGVIAGCAVLGVMVPWLSMAGVSGCLNFSRARVTEGDTVSAEVTVTNRLAWPVWGLTVSKQTAGHDPKHEARLAAVPGRRRSSHSWTFTPPCRGVYPVGRATLSTGFPFGLWHSRSDITVERELLVWPTTFPVGPPPVGSGEEQVDGNVSRNKVGTSGDVLGVRPYRRGDSTRRIHWAQSAKHDRLIVCELQSNTRSMIQIVLDVNPDSHVGDGPDGSLEWAIRVAASMAKDWLEAGAVVGLVHGGGEIPPMGGTTHTTRILDSLARVTPTPKVNLGDLLACPKCRSFREGVQVIVTTGKGMAPSHCGHCRDAHQRWVVLGHNGFTDDPQGDVIRPTGTWLWLDSPDRVPARLRSGWEEAVHGS